MAARAVGLSNGFLGPGAIPRPRPSGLRHGHRLNRHLGTRRDRLEEAHPTKGENMSVEEILGTHRRQLIADVATLAACIDECAACAATCTICADACLAEPDIAELARCIRLCLDCADACVDAGRILSRQTDPDADTQLTALDACLAACRACAVECERHAHHHEHCRLSAEQCRRCERTCDDLLAALGGASRCGATSARSTRATRACCSSRRPTRAHGIASVVVTARRPPARAPGRHA